MLKNMDWPPHSRFYRFQRQRLLGIDFGEKATGWGHFTPGSDPFPLLGGTIAVKSHRQLLEDIAHLVDELAIDAVILGVPYSRGGQVSQMAQKVLTFCHKLKGKLAVPVHTQDEALSSFEAQERMKSEPRFNFQVDPQRLDQVAATIILEDFLKSVED